MSYQDDINRLAGLYISAEEGGTPLEAAVQSMVETAYAYETTYMDVLDDVRASEAVQAWNGKKAL